MTDGVAPAQPLCGKEVLTHPWAVSGENLGVTKICNRTRDHEIHNELGMCIGAHEFERWESGPKMALREARVEEDERRTALGWKPLPTTVTQAGIDASIRARLAAGREVKPTTVAGLPAVELPNGDIEVEFNDPTAELVDQIGAEDVIKLVLQSADRPHILHQRIGVWLATVYPRTMDERLRDAVDALPPLPVMRSETWTNLSKEDITVGDVVIPAGAAGTVTVAQRLAVASAAESDATDPFMDGRLLMNGYEVAPETLEEATARWSEGDRLRYSDYPTETFTVARTSHGLLHVNSDKREQQLCFPVRPDGATITRLPKEPCDDHPGYEVIDGPDGAEIRCQICGHLFETDDARDGGS